MSTQKDTVAFILERLDRPTVFSARPMFGEYALYAQNKVVALICDDTLYVKVLPASEELHSICEQDHPYPGAKLFYVISEDQFDSIPQLADILVAIADTLPRKPLPKL